ncbi:MAG TPA: AAA family ATPase [Terriglobales bacterium]|nr:AAA family ATPase [Terriglobales bacterium]
MEELSVVLLSPVADAAEVLEVQVNGTAVAKVVAKCGDYPLGGKDPTLKRIQDARPAVIIVDLAGQNPVQAVHCIELLRIHVPDSAIFALGEMNRPQLIVDSMRSGAQEFLASPTNTSSLLDAFVRLGTKMRKSNVSGHRGKLFTVINSKGGSGATTIAVNLALSLQKSHNTALFDLAPLSNAALQLNLRPSFTVQDVLHNFHRLDQSLLEGFMARHQSGVALLAGSPTLAETERGDLAKVFDLMVSQFAYVVVDLSTRLDWVAQLAADVADDVLLVSQTDVPSLWSAARVQALLASAGSPAKLRLVLNRYRKIPGLTDSDVENSTHVTLLSKIPNSYAAVSAGIDKGSPVVLQNHSEIARAFNTLASSLTQPAPQAKESRWFTLSYERGK